MPSPSRTSRRLRSAPYFCVTSALVALAGCTSPAPPPSTTVTATVTVSETPRVDALSDGDTPSAPPVSTPSAVPQNLDPEPDQSGYLAAVRAAGLDFERDDATLLGMGANLCYFLEMHALGNSPEITGPMLRAADISGDLDLATSFLCPDLAGTL